MPDRTELVIHIGGSKCGSSAIQAWLAQNVAGLAGRGIGVPGTELDFDGPVAGQQIWFFENAVQRASCAEEVAGRMAALFETAEARGLTRLILSAENLCNHAGLAPVLRAAAGNRPVRIVMYVRRQDDFLISSWQQWHLKLYDSVEAFLIDRVGVSGRWLTMLEPWAEAFGDEALTVRPFLRERLARGDVVSDFCDVLGIDTCGLKALDKPANPSFDEALGRLAHRVRDVFEGQHDNRFYEVMVRLLGKAALKSGSGSSLIDLDTRRRIVARYAEENAALQARFMTDLGDEPVFRLPGPGEVRRTTHEDQLSDDIAMLTRAVYNLARRTERDGKA